MAIAYSEFKTTGANLLSDIRTAILACTDWSRPNAGARPDTYKCVSTNGAEMVVDLADAAAAAGRLTVAAYTSYNGTTLGTKITGTRYLYIKESGTGTFASISYYVTVSASKEGLFIMIEGPRSGETSADNATYGSARTYMFITDLVPYFSSGVDPTPVAAFYATPNANANGSMIQTNKVWLTNNKAGTSPWPQASVLSLDFPLMNLSSIVAQNRIGLDGDAFLSPYVVADDYEGVRGRLNNLFFCGFNYGLSDNVIPTLQHGDFADYDGHTYKILAVNRAPATGNFSIWGPLGAAANITASMPTISYSPLVAVPFS